MNRDKRVNRYLDNVGLGRNIGMSGGLCVDCRRDTQHLMATVGYLCLECRTKRTERDMQAAEKAK